MKKLLLAAMAFVALSVNAQSVNLKAIAQSPMCFGAATGSIYLTIDGGTAPYTYSWSNGALTPSITNLVAGTYSVTVSDSAGLNTASASVVLAEPAQLSMNALVIDASSTGGSDGGINITTRGGIYDYSYLWSSGQTTEDISNLTAGTYTVTVTDGVGCQASLTKTVSEMPSPLINFGHHMSNSQINLNNNGLIAPNAGNGKNLNISVYPNPTSNFLQIGLKDPKDSEISLYDINGKMVYAQKFSSELPKVDVSNLANGTYVVHVKTATETFNQNVSIAK